MKGIMFTEFLEMVEQRFGYNMVDTLLKITNLPSGGIYTAVGTYDYTEMEDLMSNLSLKTNIPSQELFRSFGNYLFKSFIIIYHYIYETTTDTFSLLTSIDSHIHTEVKKLYPDAELPQFEVSKINDNTLVFYYHSSLKMAGLAYGLIEACVQYFGENASITQESLNDDSSSVKFVIAKQ
ncbi:hypothetical protein EMA8858_02100 [Emticicia aquatica]|jgi:Haem-NO-binding|uniref:Heme NO-binding domain-containing protein n=1 Tax=Emticicia aquatica TaxID=1681835 RepID=A0ABN8ESP8_9BACT|nr:heme NO-binding domain-containing protein [Emticicia aquatica]CAH0995972.1 hypothetical protein EMA8858_02100 [Emticicia aquatica]